MIKQHRGHDDLNGTYRRNKDETLGRKIRDNAVVILLALASGTGGGIFFGRNDPFTGGQGEALKEQIREVDKRLSNFITDGPVRVTANQREIVKNQERIVKLMDRMIQLMREMQQAQLDHFRKNCPNEALPPGRHGG